MAARSPSATPSRRVLSTAIVALAVGALIGALTISTLMEPASENLARPARFEIVPLPEQSLSMVV